MAVNNENLSRLNAYVNKGTKSQLDAYAKENHISLGAALNIILKQFFDSQEVVANLGNFTELIKVIAIQAGIDLEQKKEV